MANVSNSYQLLLGAGEAVAVNKKKKSQNKKAKAPEEANGHHAAAHVTETNGGSKAVAGVVEVSEQIAILERAAREAKNISDKCRLWKEWTRQGADRSGKGSKYKAVDGSLLDFKQVLLLSRALEICIESSLVSGLGHEHHESLVALLTVFLGGNPDVPQALASQLVRLASLLVDEAPDTLGTAQRAVHSTISVLKAATLDESGDVDAVSGWLSRIESSDKEIRKQEGLLHKLYSTSGGVVTKEQLNCAKTIYKISEEKLDLLQPKNMPQASGRTNSSCKALDAFRAIVDSHLKAATTLEDSAKSKTASAEAQRVQTLAAYRREETIVAQESQEVTAQIRTLEAQLRALKSRQAELEEKRVQLQQRSRMVLDSMGSSRSGGSLNAAHYRDEMAVIKALDDLLNPNHHIAPEQIQNAQESQVNAPLEYMSNGQQYLTMALKSLVEIPSKLNFCKQRLSHADKLMKLVSGATSTKPKEEAEKLLADHMKTADDVNRACMQVAVDLKQRSHEISRTAPSFAAVAAEQVAAVDLLSNQIREAYDAIQAAYLAPLVEAPPSATTNGRHASNRPSAGVSSDHAAKSAGASRPISAPMGHAAATTPATVPLPTASLDAPAVAPAPVAPRQPAAPAKQWGRVEAAVPSDADSSLPTPAEAFKPAPGPSTSVDGFKEVPAKKNRKRA